jgi:alpha-1,3-mannosyltransferase
MGVILQIYHHARVCPPWVFLLLCASRRIHSIFILRCFNDCIAMLLLYIAILFILRHRWTIGCLFVTFAISVKMNVLLFVPALAILLCQRFGAWRAFAHIIFIIIVQIILAIPFLMVHARNYFRLAFDFGRAFFYIWTVNLKILDEETFLSPVLAKGLLGLHLFILIAFMHKMFDIRSHTFALFDCNPFVEYCLTLSLFSL